MSYKQFEEKSTSFGTQWYIRKNTNKNYNDTNAMIQEYNDTNFS